MLSFGVVLVYKGSGVLNFAHGAIAMFAAYLYSDLSGSGSNQAGLSSYLALVIVLGGAAIFGVFLYYAVMRQLRFAPPLAKVVATLGLLGALQGIATLHWGAVSTAVVPSLFPTGTVHILGGYVGVDRLYGLALAVALTGTLWWVYSRTRFGLATQAAAESEQNALLLGRSPHVLAAANWALGCALAAVAGMVIAPISGLDTTTLPLMILPAFAAALLGRFQSFVVALLVALGIGIAQSEVLLYWGTQPGVQVAIPLVLVLGAMVVSGRLIPQRGTLSEGRPPKTPGGEIRVLPALVVLVGAVALLVFGNPTYQTAVGTSISFAVMALSVVVISGYTGQISIAQMTFAGLAGLFLSKLANNFGVPFPLSLLLAAVLVVPIGVLVGVPALRVRGINLAVVTFSLAYAVSAVVFENAKWTGGVVLTTGATAPVPSPSIGSLSFDGLNHPGRFGLFALGVFVLVVLLVSNVRRSALGRRMLAVRSNERAAASAGIAVSRTKLQAFAISSFIAGLGGGLLSTQFNEANFGQFTALGSVSLITVAYIGGIASIAGAGAAGVAVSGGLADVILSFIPGYTDYFIAVSGILLILTVLFQPDGVAPLVEERLAVLRAKWASWRQASAKSEVLPAASETTNVS